jgi:hypothetical protein
MALAEARGARELLTVASGTGVSGDARSGARSSGRSGAVALSLSFVALPAVGSSPRSLRDRGLPSLCERSPSCTRPCGKMEVLLRLEGRGRRTDFGVATTGAERAAVLAQRSASTSATATTEMG